MILSYKVAVLVPCYNEETTIAQIIGEFKQVLPDADIYVYDNNSTDNTVDVAKQAGAFVYSEYRQGKGNVVRRMFADIEADIYLMVDGDLTYSAESAPLLINKLIEENLDMVIGKRVSDDSVAYPKGHIFGNLLFNKIIQFIFGSGFEDIFSGYRAFSKRFVKTFPSESRGFEIETELSVHALDLRLPVAEIDTRYISRPEGSSSKLSTYKDGFKILTKIMILTKEVRPLFFFSLVGFMLAFVAVLIVAPVLVTYLQTGLVPRFPTLIFALAVLQLSMLSFVAGWILDSMCRGRRELKRMHYLRFSTLKAALINHKAND